MVLTLDKMISSAKINSLKPHPINADIYDDTDLSELMDSMEANGQLEPIIVNKKNEICC